MKVGVKISAKNQLNVQNFSSRVNIYVKKAVVKPLFFSYLN
jgi:hypothetical protein